MGDTDSLTPMRKDKEASSGEHHPPHQLHSPQKTAIPACPMAETGCNCVRDKTYRRVARFGLCPRKVGHTSEDPPLDLGSKVS